MERKVSRDLLRLKLDECLAAPIADLTRRDVHIPGIRGKAMAVIGVRRGGKTSFLQTQIAERIAGGRPKESQLLVSLEDERLTALTASDLGWLLEEHGRRFPGLREEGTLTVYLDEVHLVDGWETLVRRLMDEGGIEVFVTGSSAKLLSREVATSLRGRGMEILIHPFSFREVLRHEGREPDGPWEQLAPAQRSSIEASFRSYLQEGGFPEAQQTDRTDRLALLKGYVDVMVLRDVIERHAASNPRALRWLQRHLLSTPGGAFSMKKLYDSLRSQGVPVSKDTLYEYLDHLQDAFLIRTVGMHSHSERQRMANPRKAYPIDPGLIPIFTRLGREHEGRALETAVLLELERRGFEMDWLRTQAGWEVDFFAQRSGETPLLIQVSLDTADAETWQREVRALTDAHGAYPEARATVITLDPAPPAHELPEGLDWKPASRWFLEQDPAPR